MTEREAGVTTPHTDPALKDYYEREMAKLRERPAELAFSREEYASRTARLRAAMSEERLDVVVLTAPDAMCWLHGYASRWYRGQSSTQWPPVQCTLLHADSKGPILIETSSHEELVRLTSCVDDARFIPETGLDDWSAPLDAFIGFVVDQLKAEGWGGGRVGLDRWASVPNPAVASAFEAALTAAGFEVVDATLAIRGLRRLKSAAEIAVIEQAQKVCDTGLRAIQENLQPGMTELEAWALMISAMAKAGGGPAALHESVWAAPVAMGHQFSSTRPIETGDYFIADPCGVVHRYHSNAARTFFVGDSPPDELVRLTTVLGGAFDVIRDTARVGMPFRELNKTLREYYEESGVWGVNAWAGGYELGVSFPPDWVGEFLWTVGDEDTEDVIEHGLVTNFESNSLVVMLDTLIFEDDGVRVLSEVPLELLVIS